MAETNKVLFFLDASNKWNRIIRRGVVIFVLAGISMLLKDFIVDAPEIWVPILTAVLAMIDKGVREILTTTPTT